MNDRRLGVSLSSPTLNIVPFDFATSLTMPGWRETVSWPISHAQAFSTGRASSRAFLGFMNGLADDPLRRVALLAGGRLSVVSRAITEAALCVQEEARTGIRLAGGPAELHILRGEIPPSGVASWQANSPFKPMAAPRGVWLRRIARMASYTPLWRLPATLLAPTATAISHNSLLCAFARRSSERVGFRHAELLLAEARRRRNGRLRHLDMTTLVDAVADLLACCEGLEEPFANRVRSLLLPLIQESLAQAAADLDALSAMPGLPVAMWSGSGGYYPSRAIGLEVQRRGGHVTRFSHSVLVGMMEVVETIVFTELAVSDRFVVETPALARNLAASEALGLVANFNRPSVAGAAGCPGLHRLPLVSRRRPTRRKVVYAPTRLTGFRQFFPPVLPDVIYLDWQFRLVEAMLTLPVELLCKPHPEGLLRGRPHPLGTIALTSTKRFEDVMGDADVFVFDYAQTTPFCEVLCTDRPIVFIDMGIPLFAPSVRDMLERRCRIVKAWFDSRNLPHIEEAELKEAVCGGSDRADPGEFRALLMGEGIVA